MRNAHAYQVTGKHFQTKCLEDEVRLHLDAYSFTVAAAQCLSTDTPSASRHSSHLHVF